MYTSPIPVWGSAIIAVVGGLFLLALFSCCILCLCRRRNKRKQVASRVPITDPFSKFNSHKAFVQQELNDQLPSKNLGTIYYSLDYNLQERKLYVCVIKIDNLPGEVFAKPSQPLVRVRLHPNAQSFETRHVNYTNNPLFNETFVFSLHPDKQATSTLIFTVYNFQMLSKHKRLSQLHLPLKSLMLSGVIEDFAALHEPVETEETAELGDVCVSLKYVPSQSKLVVVVIEAKNLMKQDPDYKDPYVKLYLKVNKKTIKKKKTTMNAATSNNPYYNESFEFNVKPSQIQDTSLLVRVAFKGSMGRSKYLGEVLLGLDDSGGTGNGHWSSILSSPGHPFALWHGLAVCNE